jgi:hypothetical protein
MPTRPIKPTHVILRLVVAPLCLTLVAAVRVSADPVPIRGSYSVDYGDPASWFFAGDGLRLSFSGFEPINIREGYAGAFSCNPCAAGTPIDLSERIVGLTTAPSISAIVGGIEYPTPFYSADWVITGPTVVMAQNSLGGARFTEPMSFNGRIQVFADGSGSGSPIYDATLVGIGQVSAGYANTGFLTPQEGLFNNYAYSWNFNGTAAATPEPSTFLLVGTSILVAARRARRRSRSLRWPSGAARVGQRRLL